MVKLAAREMKLLEIRNAGSKKVPVLLIGKSRTRSGKKFRPAQPDPIGAFHQHFNDYLEEEESQAFHSDQSEHEESAAEAAAQAVEHAIAVANQLPPAVFLPQPEPALQHPILSPAQAAAQAIAEANQNPWISNDGWITKIRARQNILNFL